MVTDHLVLIDHLKGMQLFYFKYQVINHNGNCFHCGLIELYTDMNILKADQMDVNNIPLSQSSRD